MQWSSRVDYDAIAELYDTDPYREKSADPELAAFMAQCTSSNTLSLLDVGCGTGRQLVANRAIAPDGRMVGVLDRPACCGRRGADRPMLPGFRPTARRCRCRGGSFDFVSCQLAFHHFRNKMGMLREAVRVLRTAGRLVIYNMCPQECRDWLCYRYFPTALRRDLVDFWPPDAIAAGMTAVGFARATIARRDLHFERDLSELLQSVRLRHSNSQLMAISDAAYNAGLRRLKRELAAARMRGTRADHLCFVTIRGDKAG